MCVVASCGSAKRATLQIDDRQVESVAVRQTVAENTQQEATHHINTIKDIDLVIEEYDTAKTDSIGVPTLRKRTTAKVRATINELSTDSTTTVAVSTTEIEDKREAVTQIENRVKKTQPAGGRILVILVVVTLIVIIIKK